MASTDEKKTDSVKIKKINLSGEEGILTAEIPGMYYQGIQYFDFKKITFINHNGIASLIKFIKYYLGKGIEVRILNLNEPIKNKITKMGLDKIFTS